MRLSTEKLAGVSRISIAALVIVLLSIPQALVAGQDSRIVGKVIDAETGEAVVGATVQIEGTTIGTAVGVDGNFLLRNISQGPHTLIVSCIGYNTLRIENVVLDKKGRAKFDVVLSPEVLETGIEQVVEAERFRNNDAALLRQRQLSNTISDAISAETILRSGSGDAAAAVSRVTGASVVGGKFVYIRGLGDRYANTKLNGSQMPSPDPDKQAVPMDLIPAGLLDNIVVEKTLTPDKPGNSTGGSVNLATKTLLGKRIIKFSNSIGYSQATNNPNFLTYSGGGKDWLGYDDGTRKLPEIVQAHDVETLRHITVSKDPEGAYFLDEVAGSFGKTMSPITGRAPVNQSYSFSFGDSYPFFSQNLVVLASLSYNRNYSFYDNGTVALYNLATAGGMSVKQELSDTRGVDEVLWGGLIDLAIPLHNKHKLNINYMRTQNAEAETRYLVGSFPEAFPAENSFFETRVLRYTERSIESVQFGGIHSLGNGRPIKLDWRVSLIGTEQDEPDLRYFSNDFLVVRTDTIAGIHTNQVDFPRRIFRDLDEDNREYAANFELPFKQWNKQPAKFKSGIAFLRKTRSFDERVFELRHGLEIEFDRNNLDDYISDENVGIIDSGGVNRRVYTFGNYYWRTKFNEFPYNSEQEIFSLYSMVELPITEKFAVVTGVRWEKTLMSTADSDTSGFIDEKDYLTSLNLIYKFTPRMNLRASYGRTLARPTLREFTPFASREYASGRILNGNVGLVESKINNFDLRWEFFSRPGEIVAVSGFYKSFEDPIERAVINDNAEIRFVNVDNAWLMGTEFELRKQLDDIHPKLRYFQIGGNLTLIKSEVDIIERHLSLIRALRPDAPATRPLQGQSPYVINLDVAYVNPAIGTSIALYYNVFGERLADVSLDATPDIYEQPRPMIDLTLVQKIWHGLELKASAKNVLNSDYREVLNYSDREWVVKAHREGCKYSIGTSISF